MSNFSKVLNLESYRYFIDTEINDTKYFDVKLLPSVLSYGKHPFTITYNQPIDSPPLQSGANLLFEFVDAKGVVIFSEITTALSGGGIGYVSIINLTLRSTAVISEFIGKFYIVKNIIAKFFFYFLVEYHRIVFSSFIYLDITPAPMPIIISSSNKFIFKYFSITL